LEEGQGLGPDPFVEGGGLSGGLDTQLLVEQGAQDLELGQGCTALAGGAVIRPR